MGKTRKRIWRGGKKEKGRDREPVLPLPSFIPFFIFSVFALSQFSGSESRSLEQAKYDRPREAFKSDGYLNCYSVSPIPGQQLT